LSGRRANPMLAQMATSAWNGRRFYPRRRHLSILPTANVLRRGPAWPRMARLVDL